MSKTRTVEISVRQLIAAIVVLILIGIAVIAFVTRDTWMQILQSEVMETEEAIASPSPTPGVTAAERAEEIALAMQVIDYHDPEGWLARLRPIATDNAYNHFKTNYVEKVWSVLEVEQVVIAADQVSVTDKGIEAEGEKWQVRKVDIHIDDPPQAWGGRDSTVYIQLLLVDGDWKLQAIVTEDELALLKIAPTRSATRAPDTSSPGMELPTPDPGKELPAAFAEQFIAAFHAVNYRDMDTWLAMMKAMSTLAGYELISSQIYPQIMQVADENQLILGLKDVTVEDQGLELEGETILGLNQVRRVYIEVPPFYPGGATSETYLIVIVQDPNADPQDLYGGWRFEEFLTQEMLDYMRGGEGGGQ
jgi:hypothetical protein